MVLIELHADMRDLGVSASHPENMDMTHLTRQFQIPVGLTLLHNPRNRLRNPEENNM